MSLSTSRDTTSTVAQHLTDHNTGHGILNQVDALFIDSDDSASTIQSKIDAGPVVLMEDISIATTLDLDREQIKIDLNGFNLTSSADPVFNIDGGNKLRIIEGLVTATGGKTFDFVSANAVRIRGVSVDQNGDYAVVSIQGGSLYDAFIGGGCEWASSGALDTPMVNVAVTGAQINAVTFERIRMQTNGNANTPTAPCVYMENTDVNWLYGNNFLGVNFEIPSAGAIHLYSCANTLIQGCGVYDSHLDSIIDSMIVVDNSATGGLNCQTTTITNYLRNAGTMAVGKYDIDNRGHYAGSLYVINPMGIGAEGVKVDTGATVVGGYQVNP